MTFELREALKLFAESKQNTFKIGFIGSKKKTEEERQRRIERSKSTSSKNCIY